MAACPFCCFPTWAVLQCSVVLSKVLGFFNDLVNPPTFSQMMDEPAFTLILHAFLTH